MSASTTSTVLAARNSLGALWFSQASRMLGDNILRAHVVLELARQDEPSANSAWHVVTFLLAAQALVFSPVFGALTNSIPRRRVLVASGAFSALFCGLYLVWHFSPLILWAGLAFSWLLYSPARYAMLPAAADDARVPLTRINGSVELGASAAVLIGLGTGVLGDRSAGPILALVLLFAGAVAAVPVTFPSDASRSEPFWSGLRDFFRDFARLARIPSARSTLLGLGALKGLSAGMGGAIVATVLQSYPADSLRMFLEAGACITIGVALGSVLAGIQRHTFRALGFVPVASVGLFFALLAIAWIGAAQPHPALLSVVGLFAGLANVPLAAAFQQAVPDDARGNAMSARNLTEYAFMAVIAGALTWLTQSYGLPPIGQLTVLAGLAGLAAVSAACVFARPFVEFASEIALGACYRVRATGPGLAVFPRRGPVLVYANHACWFDPGFLGKMLPRAIKPMMTSAFYDLPVMRFLMRHVVKAIRVANSAFRREAPELQEAVAALDIGECVVIFPEGRMRRKEEELLHPFGQGIWHILKQRPNTLVVPCWIEGNWGAYVSYKNGPPTKNKKLDWGRPITVVVGEPFRLELDVLTDHRTTRQHLMQVCLEQRKRLGLPEEST